jgi:2'-5' RNA ligase
LPSSEAARLFVAVDLSPGALADLAGLVNGLRVSRANAPGHSTRLTRPENWHITVTFLGDVPVAKVARAEAVVRDVAARGSPITLRVAGGGTFGGRRDPILWAGVGGEVERLRDLARATQRALRRARLPRDDRPPRPHLTISRPGQRVPPGEIAADMTTLNGYTGPEWTVTELHLMRSDTVQSPTGPAPRYTSLMAALLGPASSQARDVAAEQVVDPDP